MIFIYEAVRYFSAYIMDYYNKLVIIDLVLHYGSYRKSDFYYDMQYIRL